MKKPISILIVLFLLIGAGASYFVWKRPAHLGDLQAAGFIPSDSVALVEITDLPRSKTRWMETALYKISQEPEVAAFLVKPKTLVPPDKQLDRLERFQKLEPKEVFIACTGQGAGAPKVVAGFDFSGSRSDAEALVADLKADIKSQYPDGKSDLQQYGSSEIETFTHQDASIATVFKGQWFFASNDLGQLESTLDRLDGKGDPNTSLRENAAYKLCVAKLPQDSDAVVFVQTKGIIDYLDLMLSSSPNVDKAQLDALKQIQAITASMKLDGERLRDTLYIYKPGGEAREPLARNSMAFTSQDTLAYFAGAFDMGKAPSMPNPALDSSGVLAMLGGLQQALTQAGLSFDDFKATFGPEWGFVADGGADSGKPGGILALDVRDRAKAQKFIETLATGWPKQEIDGVQYYAFPPMGQGFIRVSPILALTDKELLFGSDLDSVKKAVQDANAGGAGISKDAGFQAAVSLVSKPTDTFGYVDSGALFDKIYGIVGNPLTLTAMSFSMPHINDYVDLGKLPPASAISKHLSPIVYSQSTDENGTLFESTGSVTFTEVGLVGIGAGIAVANEFPELLPNVRLPHLATPPAGQPGATSVPPVQ